MGVLPRDIWVRAFGVNGHHGSRCMLCGGQDFSVFSDSPKGLVIKIGTFFFITDRADAMALRAAIGEAS